MTRRACAGFALLVVLAAVCRPAFAEPAPAAASPTQADDPRARQFFEVGQQAYGKGQYLLAIDAFEQAYAIVQRPGLLFSLGQAHQRQFRAKAEAAHLQAALDYYRRYLAADATGRRRGEALAAIESLARTAEQLHPANGAAALGIFGKLLVSSPTPGVTVSVDGDKVDSLPASLELPNNHYRIDAQAPGFAPEQREVNIVSGISVPLNFELQPLPASLRITGSPGAEAFVDGRPIGFLPAPQLSLPAGAHWVSVRQPGRTTRTARIELLRGESKTTELSLETTTQRKAAWVAGAGGAVALLATGVFAGFALARDHRASQLEARRTRGELSRDEAEQLNAAVDERDRFRTLAIVGGVSAAALVGTALVLYVSDTPAPPEGRATLSARGSFELRGFTEAGAWGAQVSQRF